MNEKDDSRNSWGFTIVRRDDPIETEKNSVYRFLAPLNANERPRRGDVLRFEGGSLPLFPERNRPYAKHSEWGTAIKLYNYDRSLSPQILRRGGLLHRLELLLPEIALPVRLHECREYLAKGHGGSFDTPMRGVVARLNDKRSENLESEFPSTVKFQIQGEDGPENLSARIYAFKKGRARTYRQTEGIIVTNNGQSQGTIDQSFFRGRAVRMDRLATSLLVVVDFTNISKRGREKLFMSSRDRLRGGPLRANLERELETILRDHHGLRELKDSRRLEETAERLKDSKPLEETLRSILKSSPTLSSLFATGVRLSRPDRPVGIPREKFHGKRFPTFFQIKKVKDGEVLRRDCAINVRSRILFETDVTNDYFDRAEYPGSLAVQAKFSTSQADFLTYNLNLHNGIATLNLGFPDSIRADEKVALRVTVDDSTQLKPFSSEAELTMIPERIKIDKKKPNQIDTSSRARRGSAGITLPNIHKVRESEWVSHGFDKFSVCRIVPEDPVNGIDIPRCEFYVNCDNSFLRTEMKNSSRDVALFENQFIYGTVLVGLALIHAARKQTKGRTEDERIEEVWENLGSEVESATRALGPFLLPMINNLGGLTEETPELTLTAVAG
jgi:hypothetical protein